jgi:crotonobetainyl-CoA:carnitine CoA-transferase CaiB-like acyl-CoA transferase
MPDSPPLSGIKVVDFTRYLAGPFCTQILGDYGAEILKVEPVQGARGEMGDDSGKDTYFFLSTNRSKKSVQISTKAPEGRAALHRLIDSADVVIDNFRPGVMEAIGFGYHQIAARNPRIIACSISGFGATGPMRDYPGFDQIAQGFSGLMSVTGTAASGPTRVGIAICDLLGGIYAAQGILLALEVRHRTGRGQRVETSLLEAIVSTLSWSAGIYFDTGKTPGPAGNHHPLSSPHGVFMASDRPFNIAVGNEAMWRTFVKVIGHIELAEDDRFNRLGRRIKNRDALTAEINSALKAHPAQHWMDLFNESGIPVGTDPDDRGDVPAAAGGGARDAGEAGASRARRIQDHRTRSEAERDAGTDYAAATGRRAYRRGPDRTRLHARRGRASAGDQGNPLVA